jgi:hypothetical protein
MVNGHVGWVLAGVTVVVIGAGVTLAHGPGRKPPRVPVTATNHRVPAVVRRNVSRDGQPTFSLPAGTRLSAYAPLANGNLFAYAVLRTHRHVCELAYEAHRRTFAPVLRNALGVVSGCHLISSELPESLNLAPATIIGPMMLYGTAPRSADRVELHTDTGRTYEFSLPHVPVTGDRGREAVVLDLTRLGNQLVRRATLMDGGRVVEVNPFFP